ncbi:uncharacterized protein LOC110455969 isoform X2 [Mizuhopecten yessoensis]|uniref:uncharacterized protein LOC110455969 isoform X2 n=1 Tax=Mizuhopecten yessoensis TaxID=6573 RepID=UPI000B45AEF4|nr:uncharacterized protein LOC110455969 isoform X2 [Mizuhopecten yessoensis]
MIPNTDIVKGLPSPDGKSRNPKLTITIDKGPQQIVKPKSISPRNKTASVGIFPPIAEEHLLKKSQQAYPISPKTVNHEAGTVTFKQDHQTICPITTVRRSSITNGGGLVKKASFKGMGKFSTVLKAKMAFKSHNKRPRDNPVDDEEEDLIIELPKEPRFSTMMSPEAQYAMMKGYEDTIYNCLCKKYPEQRPSLRRNRTPISNVDLRNKEDTRKVINKEDQDSNQELPLRHDSEREESDTASQGSSNDSPLTGPSFNFSPPRSANMSRRASMPVPSISLNKIGRSRSLAPSGTVSVDSTLSRANSLPSVIPREKQLVLSYRLQSAMDILDTVRDGLGYNYTSPRIRANTSKGIKPVLDYNKWAGVWGQEFNVHDPLS